MDQHKFKAFLRSRQWSDPLGPQFVYHALGDRTLPDAGSWQQLKAYLMEREASAETLSAAEYIWQQYDASTQEGRRRACRKVAHPKMEMFR